MKLTDTTNVIHLHQYGPAWWEVILLVAAAIAAYDLACWAWDWAADWWHDRREAWAAADDIDGSACQPGCVVAAEHDPDDCRTPQTRPENVQFTPDAAAPPDVRERQAQGLWWATHLAIHRAECRYAHLGVPLPFVISVEDARKWATDDRLRACLSCRPLQPRAAEAILAAAQPQQAGR